MVGDGPKKGGDFTAGALGPCKCFVFNGVYKYSLYSCITLKVPQDRLCVPIMTGITPICGEVEN